MRCKACDKAINKPIKVTDQLTQEVYEEWLCSKCNKYSFANGSGDSFNGVIHNLHSDGFIRIEEQGDNHGHDKD